MSTYDTISDYYNKTIYNNSNVDNICLPTTITQSNNIENYNNIIVSSVEINQQSNERNERNENNESKKMLINKYII